jgi:hypothetical protein
MAEMTEFMKGVKAFTDAPKPTPPDGSSPKDRHLYLLMNPSCWVSSNHLQCDLPAHTFFHRQRKLQEKVRRALLRRHAGVERRDRQDVQL